MNRKILVASFIYPSKLDWFLDILLSKFQIEKDKVFLFKNLNDDSKIITTFKLNLLNGEKIQLSDYFPNSTIIHKKGLAIYTINALNKLIELDDNLEEGNINHQTYQIDWNKYQNKMILMNNDNLVFIDIERIF